MSLEQKGKDEKPKIMRDKKRKENRSESNVCLGVLKRNGMILGT